MTVCPVCPVCVPAPPGVFLNRWLPTADGKIATEEPVATEQMAAEPVAAI